MELKVKRYVVVQVWFAAVELVPGLRFLSSCFSRVSVISKRPVSRIYHLPSSAVKKLVCVCVRRRFGMFLVEVSLGMFHGISTCDARLYLDPVISLPQDALVPLLGLFDGVDVGL